MSKSSKKIWILLIVISMAVYAYHFRQNQEKLKNQHFIDAQAILHEELLAKSKEQLPHFVEKPFNNERSDITIFFPTDVNGNVIPLLESQLNELAQDLPEKKADDTFIFIRTIQNSEQKNMNNYSFIYDFYTWDFNKERWSQESKEVTQNLTLNEITYQPLTLGDVFNNDPVNLLQFKTILRREILEAETTYTNYPEEVFELTQLDNDLTDILLTDQQLVINFASNNIGLEQFTLDYSEIGPYLNPDFINEEDIIEPQKNNLDNNKKYIALTFDDGPNNTTTPEILKILKEKNAPATFFLLGQQVEKFPELVKQMNEDGHELGNHSYNHPNLVGLPPEEVTKQIEDTEIAIYKASGALPKTVRPPYGSVNSATASAIGLPIAQWSIDSLDWKTHNAQQIQQEVQATAFNGGVVLMHDIHAETVQALPQVIDSLRAQGYEFLTFSEILKTEAVPMQMYYSSVDQKSLQ